MGLNQLPPELIGKIVDELPWSDLNHFSRTSRRFHAFTVPYLRRDAVLTSSNGWTLLRQHVDLLAALEHATSVTVVSPVPDETAQGSIRGRCPGCNHADSQKARDNKELDDKKVLIHEALGSCRTNRLRKFTWMLGICVQNDVLGSNGILATHQSRLEEITLMTCYHRLGLRCQTRSIDLTPFAHLQSLSWTGIHRFQYPVVERALASAAPRLATLELDYLGHMANYEAPDSNSGLNHLVRVILGLREGGAGVAFPRLEDLSFTNVDLSMTDANGLSTQRAGEFCLALNVPNLASLKLKQCPAWNNLVSSAPASGGGVTLPLRALEIHSHPGDPGDVVASALEPFLEACPGLEDLVIYKARAAAVDANPCLALVRFGLPRLKRAVFHEGSSLPPIRRPPDHVWEAPEAEPELEPGQNPLSHSRLEFLGCAVPLHQSKKLLENSIVPEALADLRILHVRQDHEEIKNYYSRAVGHARPDEGGGTGRGIDLRRMLTRACHDLATWIFTSDRFRSLEVLAFGDFGSFDPRVRLLLCRSSYGGGGGGDGDGDGGIGKPRGEPFRLLEEGDSRLVSLLDKFADSLVVGPSYARPHLRSSGASLAGNVWRPGLGTVLARESGERVATVPGEGGVG